MLPFPRIQHDATTEEGNQVIQRNTNGQSMSMKRILSKDSSFDPRINIVVVEAELLATLYADDDDDNHGNTAHKDVERCTPAFFDVQCIATGDVVRVGLWLVSKSRDDLLESRHARVVYTFLCLKLHGQIRC